MQELQDTFRDYSAKIPSDTQQLIEMFVPWVEKILKSNKR
jgi:F0F1-type ATP synthase membrane subunit a